MAGLAPIRFQTLPKLKLWISQAASSVLSNSLACRNSHPPEKVACWVIGTFAGLRSAELERLEWKDIRFERILIELGAAKAKTRAREFRLH